MMLEDYDFYVLIMALIGVISSVVFIVKIGYCIANKIDEYNHFIRWGEPMLKKLEESVYRTNMETHTNTVRIRVLEKSVKALEKKGKKK